MRACKEFSSGAWAQQQRRQEEEEGEMKTEETEAVEAACATGEQRYRWPTRRVYGRPSLLPGKYCRQAERT